MNTVNDTICQPLAEVVSWLAAKKIPYIVHRTYPDKKILKLDEQNLYVVRQRMEADGVLHLVAAAKMGKEV